MAGQDPRAGKGRALLFVVGLVPLVGDLSPFLFQFVFLCFSVLTVRRAGREGKGRAREEPLVGCQEKAAQPQHVHERGTGWHRIIIAIGYCTAIRPCERACVPLTVDGRLEQCFSQQRGHSLALVQTCARPTWMSPALEEIAHNVGPRIRAEPLEIVVRGQVHPCAQTTAALSYIGVYAYVSCH